MAGLDLGRAAGELFCPVRVRSRWSRKAPDSMPQRRVRWNQLGLVNDLRMFDLLQLKPDKGAMMKKIVLGKELDVDGYALAWGLADYLVQQAGQAVPALQRNVAAIEPLADFDPNFERTAREMFVDDMGNDLLTAQADVGKYLNSAAMQAAIRDPYVIAAHYLVVHTAKRGKARRIDGLITTSPTARGMEEEESGTERDGRAQHASHDCLRNPSKAEAELTKMAATDPLSRPGLRTVWSGKPSAIGVGFCHSAVACRRANRNARGCWSHCIGSSPKLHPEACSMFG